MASKYYNPTLAGRVAKAQSTGFLDAGEAFEKGYQGATDKISPYAMGVVKEYEEDVKNIYNINFDENGIAAHQLGDLKDFVKQQKQAAFEARQKGVLPGKEGLGEAMMNVKGAANVAKTHGAYVKEIQNFLNDPDRVSTANDKENLPALTSIANARIDYSDPDGKFYVLPDGKTKYSAEDIQKELDNLIEVPDEAYLGLYDKSQNLVKEKYDDFGQKYYAFDELNSAQMRTIVFDTIDEHGKDFVYDAMSNKNAYRGVTVSEFINDDLANKIGQTYGYTPSNEALPNLQGKTKSEIDKTIANKFGINLETPEGKSDVFRIHKELVSSAYTEALRTQYPDRSPQFKKPEVKPGPPTVSGRVDEVVRDMVNLVNTSDVTTDPKTGKTVYKPGPVAVDKFEKYLNEQTGLKVDIIDRPEAKTLYINRMFADPNNEKSKQELGKDFENEYPISRGQVFEKDTQKPLNLSSPRALSTFILERMGGGVSGSYNKFLGNAFKKYKVASPKMELVGIPTGGTSVNMAAEETNVNQGPTGSAPATGMDLPLSVEEDAKLFN